MDHQNNPPSTPHGAAPPPDPFDQQAAIHYARRQIAEIYGETGTAAADTSAPQEYAHTFNADTRPADGQTYSWQEYHAAWQHYYQEYYQRYYLGQHPERLATRRSNEQPKAAPAAEPPALPTNGADASRLTAMKALKGKLLGRIQERTKKAQASPHFKPLVTALIVAALFLFLQFNRTIIAQAKYYISPGTLVSEGSSIIIDPVSVGSVGPEPRIIIPKINVEVPVVYDEPSFDEAKIQKALERGVVHYGTSAVPSEAGNNVIVGHSSNDLFDAGDYKFAFVLIDRLEKGDVLMLNYKGQRYVYKVTHKQIIDPSDFSLINITPDTPTVTLITCTPPGTALKRLVVQAEQISPDPGTAQIAEEPARAGPADLPANIPGNSPTLLERVKGVFD